MKKIIVLTMLMLLVVGGMAQAVNLTYWGYSKWEKDGAELGWFEQNVIDEFEAKHPEVNIDFQIIPYNGGPAKVNMAIASDTTPDILYDGDARLLSYAAQDQLVPFDLTEQEDKNLYDSVENFSSIDNELYIYPVTSYISAITVNKGIVDKADYDIPEDRQWTIAEFEEFLQAVKPHCEIPFAFGIQNEQGDDRVRLFLQNFGTDFIDNGEVVIDSEAGVEGLKWLEKAQDNGWTYSNPGTVKATGAIEDYLAGKAGAIIYGGAYFLAKDNIDKVNSIMMNSPAPEGKTPKTVASTNGFAVFDNGNSEKIKWAKKFIRFFVNNYGKEATAYQSRFATWEHTAPNYDSKEMNVLGDFVQYATYKGTDLAEYGQLRSVFYPEMQAVFANMKTSEQALEDFARKANDILE